MGLENHFNENLAGGITGGSLIGLRLLMIARYESLGSDKVVA